MFEVGTVARQFHQLAATVRGTDGATVPASDWIDLVGQAQEAMNILAAIQTIGLAQLAATDEDIEDGELVEVYRGLGHQRLDAPDLVSGVLGVTATTAATKLTTAVDLATRHMPVIDAMAAGRLDLWRASIVADELTDASPETCTEVIAKVGDTLGAESAGALRRRLRWVLAAVDADAVRVKAARARSERSLRRTAFGLGVDEWSAKLPVEDSRTAWTVVDSLARSYLTSGRATGIEQARADALLDLIHARATGHVDLNLTVPASLLASAGDVPTGDSGATRDTCAGGGRDGAEEGREGDDSDVLVPVTGFGMPGVTHVRASWLAGLAGTSPSAGTAPDAGTTPSEEGSACRVASVGVARAWIVGCADDTGALGTLPIPTTGTSNRQTSGTSGDCEAYRPPDWMIRFVKTRDGSCRFPGCTVSVRFCDLDHVRPWPTGPTHPDNLACVCRRHHRVKQRPGWRVVLHPDASMSWTDPTGATRTTAPVDHLQLEHAQAARAGARTQAPTSAALPGEGWSRKSRKSRKSRQSRLSFPRSSRTSSTTCATTISSPSPATPPP